MNNSIEWWTGTYLALLPGDVRRFAKPYLLWANARESDRAGMEFAKARDENYKLNRTRAGRFASTEMWEASCTRLEEANRKGLYLLQLKEHIKQCF
jgi:hypothetical protein